MCIDWFYEHCAHPTISTAFFASHGKRKGIGHFAFFSPENHEKKMPLNVFQIGDEPLKYGFRATSTTT